MIKKSPDQAERRQQLAQIDILSRLSDADLIAFARSCRWRHVRRDQQILGYLDEGRDVYFVISGRVRVEIFSASGREVIYRDIGAGGLFGEFAAIDMNSRSASVIALMNCELAQISSNDFLAAVDGSPAFARALLQHLVGLVREHSGRVMEFATLAVSNRIHAELLRLAKSHRQDNNTATISPAPTHAEIAARVSTHREAVSREIARLRRGGLITTSRRTLIVTDLAALEKLVREIIHE